MVRTALHQAAHTILTRATEWSSLKAWVMRIAQRRGMAKVALVRKLGVVPHRMWLDETEFRWISQRSREARKQAQAEAAA